MLKNYIKIAFRNLTKHRVYSIINIAGLALGMLCCLLILLWVQDELSFDRFHKNENRLYLVVNQFHGNWIGGSSWALAPILKNDFPEIEKATRFAPQETLVNYKDKRFYESVAFVDPDFLQMFTFPLLEGDPTTALDVTESVIISEDAARKYFSNEDPIGKIINISRETNLTVTGIIKNAPANSSLTFDMLVPIKNLGEDRLATWSIEAPAFVLLGENVALDELKQKMSGTSIKYDTRSKHNIINSLQPISEIHLYSLNGMGSILYVYIFAGVAIVVLLVACINFVNLVTAKASVRGREIGVRKVVGAGKNHIVWQFYGETLLLAILAFILANSLASLVLPAFNTLAEKQLSLDFSNFFLLAGSTAIIFLTTLFAGSYPALLLSGFQPIKVLKNSQSTGFKKSVLRSTLVVFQFVVSIVLIILTLTMSRQMEYIQNKNLGFNREQVIAIPYNETLRNQYQSVKNKLLQYTGITHVTSATAAPSNIGYANPVSWEGRVADEYETMNYVEVDYDYLETFEIELAEGRNFSREFSTDQENYVVNQAAVEYMKMESPVGKRFSIWTNEGKIIGVVKNFHFNSLREEIRPVVMTFAQYMPHTSIYIRIKPEEIKTSLAYIEKIWTENIPNYPLQYEFLDETFRHQYDTEQRINTLFSYFSVFAIFISCIGLIGLAAFVAEFRTKEIGIRKVVGASLFNVIGLMLKDFAKWILVAVIIASPIAYYAMNLWLENFAYRIDVNWTIFAIANMIVFLVAVLTVSWQAIRAATANPVEALRYE